MKIAEMCMALLLVMGAVDLVADYPEDSLRQIVSVLELVAAIWFFMDFVPKIIRKMKNDSKFTDFVISLTVTVGLMLCIGYSREDLMQDERIATIMFLGVFAALLLSKRLIKYLARKYSKEIKTETDIH